MPHSALLVITGASGVGKTTLVLGLEARELPGIQCHYFDSIGVPSPDEMIRHYGGAEEWQRGMTTRWVQRLAVETAPGTLSVLDGQVRPSVVRAALARTPAPTPATEILLVDCAHAVREARLRTSRGRPELATPEMMAWAAYLRGQADALQLPRMDTSSSTVKEGVELLSRFARRLVTAARGPR